MFRPALFALALALPATLPLPTAADEFRDTLDAAIEAYEAGDTQLAMEELGVATGLLQTMRAGSIESFLPPASEGWTRTVDPEYPGVLAMMGGGVGVDADYRGPDRQHINVTVTADSPIVTMFLSMAGNPAMMRAMGTVHRIGRDRVLEQDGELIMVLAGRIVIQMTGGEVDQMLEMFEQMDLAGLARFDQ